MPTTIVHIAVRPASQASIAAARDALSALAAGALAAIGTRVRRRLEDAARDTRTVQRAAAPRFPTTDDHEQALRRFLDAIREKDLAWSAATRKQLRALLADVSAERATAALDALAPYVKDDVAFARMLTQANDAAVDWAQGRAGNLITMVTTATKNAVNEMTAAAIRDGTSSADFAEQLSNAWEFGEERALAIARTELAEATTAGTLAGFRESGVVEAKEWSANDEACDECAALDGVSVPLDEEFPDDGGDGPPLHPLCECAVVAVVTLSGEEDTD